jgi:hypothetical protein
MSNNETLQFEEEVEILEEQLIGFLKDKYKVIPTPENPLCCDDETRQYYINQANNDINIYKKLLINFYSERTYTPDIIRDLTNFLFPEEYLPSESRKDKRKINDGLNIITVRKDKSEASPAKINKSVFSSYKAEDFKFGGRRKSKRRKHSKKRRNSRKRRHTKRRR